MGWSCHEFFLIPLSPTTESGRPACDAVKMAKLVQRHTSWSLFAHQGQQPPFGDSCAGIPGELGALMPAIQSAPTALNFSEWLNGQYFNLEKLRKAGKNPEGD
jgi:hypothetical protein